jgi:hypothetical protein
MEGVKPFKPMRLLVHGARRAIVRRFLHRNSPGGVRRVGDLIDWRRCRLSGPDFGVKLPLVLAPFAPVGLVSGIGLASGSGWSARPAGATQVRRVRTGNATGKRKRLRTILSSSDLGVSPSSQTHSLQGETTDATAAPAPIGRIGKGRATTSGLRASCAHYGGSWPYSGFLGIGAEERQNE